MLFSMYRTFKNLISYDLELAINIFGP